MRSGINSMNNLMQYACVGDDGKNVQTGGTSSACNTIFITEKELTYFRTDGVDYKGRTIFRPQTIDGRGIMNTGSNRMFPAGSTVKLMRLSGTQFLAWQDNDQEAIVVDAKDVTWLGDESKFN